MPQLRSSQAALLVGLQHVALGPNNDLFEVPEKGMKLGADAVGIVITFVNDQIVTYLPSP